MTEKEVYKRLTTAVDKEPLKDRCRRGLGVDSKVDSKVDKCTCSSSFQTGVCQWCIDQYERIYNG